MRNYMPNPACRCGRCATQGLMGPAVLITLGVLFLLANMSDWPFSRTWPILLIVIGAVHVVRYVVSDETHFNPGQYPASYGTPYQQTPPGSVPFAGYAPPQPNAQPTVIPPEAKHEEKTAQNGDEEVNHG